MKIAFILVLIALAKATDFNLELEEGGERFVEKIKVDTEANTEEYSVPKHANRVAIDTLKDFTKGLKAEKLASKGACYITELSRDDEIPAAVNREMQLTGAKFPSKIKVIDNLLLPVGEISEEEVGSKIAAYCKGLKLVKVLAVEKDKINGVVKDMLKDGEMSFPKQTKRYVWNIQDFKACTSSDVQNYRNCPDNVSINCVTRGWESCTYTITCPWGAHGWRCEGRHELNSITCCRFIC